MITRAGSRVGIVTLATLFAAAASAQQADSYKGRLSAVPITAATAGTTLGLVFAIGGAFCNAGSVIQTRRLTETETTSSIVFYFSLICALAGLAT